MSTKQRCVHRSKTCCQTLNHFENVISICRENILEVFESLRVILTIINAISNLPSSSTKWLPIMTYIHTPPPPPPPPENTRNIIQLLSILQSNENEEHQ